MIIYAKPSPNAEATGYSKAEERAKFLEIMREALTQLGDNAPVGRAR